MGDQVRHQQARDNPCIGAMCTREIYQVFLFIDCFEPVQYSGRRQANCSVGEKPDQGPDRHKTTYKQTYLPSLFYRKQ